MQEFPLTEQAALPDGADGVNDILGLEQMPAGNASGSRWAMADFQTFGEQAWPGGPMNCTIDATSTAQGFIGGGYNGINGELGDVAGYDF
jgi:hypothetical protein